MGRKPLVVELLVRSRMVKIQIWRAQVGRVDLYLLDTDREDNDPIDRWLTGHLYGGNQETRIAQEIVLGIGGVRALQAVGIEPGVYHLNEGHAAFCLLEVARLEIQKRANPSMTLRHRSAIAVFSRPTRRFQLGMMSFLLT